MAEKILIKDLQKLDPGSELVQLFEIEYAKNTYVYVMSGLDSDLQSVQFRDYTNNGTIRTYTAIPLAAEGFESANDGKQPRPTLSIANATTAFSGAIGTKDFDSLVGLKIIRRLTLKKYLYGESGDAQPPVEYPRQVWYVDRIKSRNKVQIQLELASPFDLDGIQLPRRSILANRCPFIYQGASDHLQEYEKAQSGCIWNVDSTYNLSTSGYDGGTVYKVYANEDDEYVIPESIVSGLTATNDPGSTSANTYYKKAVSAVRFNANGTTTNVTLNTYYQATRAASSGTAITDDNTLYKKVRVYTTYSHGTEYFTFTDDRYNNYVVFTDNVSTSATYNKLLMWKAKAPSISVKPDFGGFWSRGDLCSKDLDGCKMRFGFVPLDSGNASSTGAANPTTTAELPFGGFPAAKAFS